MREDGMTNFISTKTVSLSLSASIVFGCSSVSFAEAPSLDGFWVSDGYGLFVDKNGDTLAVKEVTRVSCIPSMIAKRESVSENEEKFMSRDINSEGGGPSTFKAFAVGDRMHVRFEGAVSDVMFYRTKSRPEACAKPTPNTPQSNYAVFWQSWADHYPFFKMRNADWNAVDRKIRPTITGKTTPRILFTKLKSMIAPFQDAHTGIRAPGIKAKFHGMRPGLYPSRMPDDKRVLGIIADKYLSAPLKSYCNNQLQYSVLKDGTAYLRIISFYDYLPNQRFSLQAEELHKALDSIMSDVSKRRGLIIDERINDGGSDEFGNIIAGRLTKSSYLAYRKVIRNDLEDKGSRTTPQDSMVETSSRPSFHGKVVLLTGNDSVSAAETFAMALLGRSDRVIRIGQPTQGVFSDVLVRHMPNGWDFGLPNEIYLTEDGRAFDGPGLLPDIATPVFSDDDLAKGNDPALEAAQAVIAGTQTAR
jgi:Peptidase family S41